MSEHKFASKAEQRRVEASRKLSQLAQSQQNIMSRKKCTEDQDCEIHMGDCSLSQSEDCPNKRLDVSTAI